MRNSEPPAQLDAIDRAILRVLQVDARLTNVQLAERVHLSPSACLRRVRQLEESGVIARYVALLDARAVGQSGTSFTIVNVERTTIETLQRFEAAVQLLIRFTYQDAQDLERFHAEVLTRLPGVVRSNSMLVLRTVKKTTALDV
jgi:Lrp/AsnC family transcriptional regulator, leucine-responsive regulatory protein